MQRRAGAHFLATACKVVVRSRLDIDGPVRIASDGGPFSSFCVCLRSRTEKAVASCVLRRVSRAGLAEPYLTGQQPAASQ